MNSFINYKHNKFMGICQLVNTIILKIICLWARTDEFMPFKSLTI